MRALVTGGYFDDSGEGVIWLIDTAKERAEVILRWDPPAHLRVPTKGLAGGSIGPDGVLYVAAHAAVVRVDPTAGRVTGVLHQPCMNDLHHVAAIGDRLYVSNTGLGAVDVLSLEGTFVGSYSLLPSWVNARRIGGEDPGTFGGLSRVGWEGGPPAEWPELGLDDGYYAADRRAAPFHQLKVPDFRHINHVAKVGGRLLATCLVDGCLWDIEAFESVCVLADVFPHDGVAHSGSFWLTAIDGSLIELDLASLKERRRLSTFETSHYGWCRGLAVADDHLLVGLTEVRRGRLPKHRWAERDPSGSETSVLMLDRRDGRVMARVDLTDKARHSKIYSVIPIGVDAPVGSGGVLR